MTFATEAERQAFEAGRQQGQTETLDVAAVVAGLEPRALLPAGGEVPTLPQLADKLAMIDANRLAILRPYDPAESVVLKEAASIAARHANTVSEWAERYRIGRLVVGRLEISRPALLMLLDGDALALAALLSGRREDPIVVPYMRRAGL